MLAVTFSAPNKARTGNFFMAPLQISLRCIVLGLGLLSI